MKTQMKILLCALITILMFNQSQAQSDIVGIGTGHIRANGYYLGWNPTGVAGSLVVRNDFAGWPINFFTGGATPLFQRMTILGSGGPFAGFVGINTPTPGFRLEVDNDINLTNSVQNQGYRIGGIVVLQKPGLRNTFVGENSGISTTTAYAGTFIGRDAGRLNTTGRANTFVGSEAGPINSIGEFNTFIGDEAGLQNTIGNSNTFVGHHTGLRNTTGSGNSYFGSHAGTNTGSGIGNWNTFLGFSCGPSIIDGDDNVMAGNIAGQLTTTGNRNVFIGNRSARSNTSGSDNVYLGYRTAFFSTLGDFNIAIGRNAGATTANLGTNNIIIGHNADISGTGFTNAAAIGTGAIVNASHKMILGNDNVFVGIGLSNDITSFLGPQAKLEIDAGLNGHDASSPGTLGASGLRFRDLHDGNTPSPQNSTNTVLSVNDAGDVILVEGGKQLGGYCPAPTTSGLSVQSWDIPLNDYNYIFSGQSSLGGSHVGIGTGCNPKAKLHVLQNSITEGTIAISAENFDIITTANQTNFGIRGYVNGASILIPTSQHIAGWFYAENAATNYGIKTIANNGKKNFGGYFEAINGLNNYGIYATVIGNYPNNVAGYFNGDVYSTGNYWGSDAILKENVTPLTNAMNIINQISPKTFTYKTNQYPQMNLPTGSQFGMIAQDVESILPNLVKEVVQPEVLDTAGNVVNAALTFKSLKYEAFIPILIQSVKELGQSNAQKDSVINSLNDRLTLLESAVTQCCQQNGGAKIVNTINVELSNDAVLYQNIPNPFGEETTINYFIPENTGNAKIIFFDMYGQSMKDVQLTTTGSGNIHVDSKNLASGIYSYSLLIDGKIIDTKKMVKSK
jgi:hypothetical protein